jgi:pimeloyl-ACP methyl ester carboxylesterase
MTARTEHVPSRLLSLSVLSALCVAGTAIAAGPDAIPVDQVAAAYVHAHARVEVEPGRRMNIHCVGEGSPVVVFDSGLSDWSNTWALIQPAVATRTRACTYDRPGMGYSDPSKHPPTPDNAVRDLHALLERAGVRGPLLLVGHSLGGFNMKLYAATYPAQVAGMVLVDPSEERLWPRVGAALAPRFGEQLVREAEADDAAGIKEGIAHFQACASAARQGPLDDATYARCSDPVRVQLGPVINAERRRLQPSVAYQAAQADEFAYSMFAPDAEADARYARMFGGARPFGDKPLIVLTHALWDMAPPFGEIGWMSWLTAHRQTAAMSSRGIQRTVPMTRHNIQVDQPQAVIDAVAEVLDALKAP